MKNVICTVHTTSCYELHKHTRPFTISSSNTITLIIHQHDNFTIDINTITLNTPHHFFYFTYCLIDTNLEGILRDNGSITQMYIICNQTLQPRGIPPTKHRKRIPSAR